MFTDANRYRLVALDMDGTLLNSEHETSAYTRAVLHHVRQAGKLAALCTGRCLSELREHLAANPDIRYVIGENGAMLYDAAEDRILRQIVLADDVTRRVFQISNDYDVIRQAFFGNQSYIEWPDGVNLARYHIDDYRSVFERSSIIVPNLEAQYLALGLPAEKINLYFRTESDRTRGVAALGALGQRISGSIGLGIEISPTGATKAAGLQALCDVLGLTLEETMAIGDGGNDIDLMRAAGFSIAMGNAIDDVRALADAVTDDCDHDGAAHAIEAFMLA